MLGEAERPAAVDARRLERGAAAQQRLVVRRRTRARRGRRRPRPATATASSFTRRPCERQAHPGRHERRRRQQRPRLDPRLLDLGLGIGVSRRCRRRPTGARGPPPARRCGSSAPGRSRRPGAATPSAPIDAPRPTGSSAAIRSTRRDLRRARHRAAGEVAPSISASVASSRSRALDRRDEMRDARELALLHQLRPADRARLAHAREVVPLEVDDHHVLGRVLRVVDVLARRPRALDRHRQQRRPAPREEALGRGRDDRPAVADERPRRKRPQRRERGRERLRRRPRTAPTGAGRGSPGRRRRARSPRAPPRSPPRSRRRPRSAPTRRRRSK